MLSYSFGFACSKHGLHTQSDVDNLICTGITSDVTIEQTPGTLDPITNLNTLSTILSIGNTLIIRNNPDLVDINGLSNLTFLGGDLIVENNPLLLDCCALDGLINQGTVGGRISMSNNGDGNCNNNGSDIVPCPPIPTVTTWGMIIMILALMIIGVLKLYAKRLDLSNSKIG